MFTKSYFYKSLFLLTALLLVLYANGCKGPEGPQGPPGSNLSGDLVGWVKLYDLLSKVAIDNSGVTVTVEGKGITTTTTADGKWTLSGIPAGTYNISWTKTGYGTAKRIGYGVVGGGAMVYGLTHMYQIPSFTVTGLAATTSPGLINLSGNLVGTLPTYTRNITLFAGTTSNVSSDPANYLAVSWGYATSSSTTFNGSFSTYSLNNAGIPAGATVYIVAYADSWGSSLYIDVATGRYVYTTINPTPSNVVPVVVPPLP